MNCLFFHLVLYIIPVVLYNFITVASITCWWIKVAQNAVIEANQAGAFSRGGRLCQRCETRTATWAGWNISLIDRLARWSRVSSAVTRSLFTRCRQRYAATTVSRDSAPTTHHPLLTPHSPPASSLSNSTAHERHKSPTALYCKQIKFHTDYYKMNTKS